MNERDVIKTEQGEGTTLIGKLFLTAAQRKTLTKWGLFALLFLLLQVLQDVLFSRARIFGGCPDVVPALLLLVCFTQDTASGALYVMGCCVFRCLCGVAMGPVSLGLLVFAGVFLSVMRRTALWGEVRSVLFCCSIAILGHQLVIFGLGVFLEHTTWNRIGEALGGCLGAWLAVPVLYPVVLAIGKTGGEAWKD